MKTKRKKVGKIAIELQNKQQNKIDPIELQREMTRDYIDNLIKCVDINKNKYNGKFFVVVLTKRETLLTNIMRNMFFARETCPTPTFDQSVFRADPHSYDLEYIWTVPTEDTCEYIKNNALLLPEDHKELRQFVFDFYDGTLDKICGELNNEFNNEIKIIS